MSTPASFSCATAETSISVNAMSDLVRRQVAPDDVEKYNLPWLYTHVPINNGFHRDSVGNVIYYTDEHQVKSRLHALIHYYNSTTGPQLQHCEAFKRSGERELATVFREHVLFPMYEEKISTTAFDLDKVKEIFTQSSHPSSQGGLFFDSLQVTEIVQDLVSGDRPVMIKVPDTDEVNGGSYYFPEPDVGDVIGIVVNCADNSSETTGDVIHSTPQRFVMCMILHEDTTPEVGWQTAANVPTFAEVVEGVDNSTTALSMVETLGATWQALYNSWFNDQQNEEISIPMFQAKDDYTSLVTSAIETLSTQYRFASSADKSTIGTAYTAMVSEYVSRTLAIWNKLQGTGMAPEHATALQARVVEKTALGVQQDIDEAVEAYDTFATNF